MHQNYTLYKIVICQNKFLKKKSNKKKVFKFIYFSIKTKNNYIYIFIFFWNEFTRKVAI